MATPDLSEQLRRALAEAGEPIVAIAARAKLEAGMLRRFVQGKRGLTLDSAARVADVLGLKLVETGRRRGR